MASELVRINNSGVYKMLERLSALDPRKGIIEERTPILRNSLAGLIAGYGAGAYSDKYAKEILGAAINGEGVTTVGATRLDGVATMSVLLKSSFSSETFEINIPHGAYE